MCVLREKLGKDLYDLIDEPFLDWCQDTYGIEPEEIGTMMGGADQWNPQRGWYSDTFVREKSREISDYTHRLRNLLWEFKQQ